MERCRIPFEALTDLQDGRLEAAARDRLSAHVSGGCRRCAETLAFLSRFRAAASGCYRFAPSEAAIETARSIYRERFRISERPSLVAQLLFDSRWGLARASARGVSASHHSVFSAGAFDIDVWQEREADGGSYLIAQVLDQETGTALAASAAELSGVAEPLSASLRGNEAHFSGVPDGPAVLTIEVAGATIEIGALSVGEEAPPDAR